jgi:protein gp37
MNQTKIEYSEKSWNPVTGCTKISAGCKNCYAETMTRRLQGMGQRKYQNGFDVTLHPETLEEPYKLKKPSIIFVCSMSDLFHRDVPVEFIQEVFKVMRENPRHVFLVLTKRVDQLLCYDQAGLLHWTDNIWAGVTVEDNRVTERIDLLRQTGARNKFISCEPLLSPIPEMDLTGIDWVIVGGESGPGARPMMEDWVIDIRDQCQDLEIAFFFKQWGGVNKKAAGRLLDGRTWDEKPMKKELTLFD